MTTYIFENSVRYNDLLAMFHKIYYGENDMVYEAEILNDYGCRVVSIDSNDIFHDYNGVNAVCSLFGYELSDDGIHNDDVFAALNNVIWNATSNINEHDYKITIVEMTYLESKGF